VKVLFDRICGENGIDHLLTQPRSPTTTGQIERFHRTLRAEFDTRRTFPSLRVAQQALDEWVGYYNTARPHQAIGDATPAERFAVAEPGSGSADPVAPARPVVESARATDREGDGWVSRNVGRNGIVCVSWQQVSVGKHRAGSRCDVLVSDQLLQFWIGSELMKTVTRRVGRGGSSRGGGGSNSWSTGRGATSDGGGRGRPSDDSRPQDCGEP